MVSGHTAASYEDTSDQLQIYAVEDDMVSTQFQQLILTFYDSVMILYRLILSIKFSPNITRSLFQSQEIAVTVETTSARNAVSNTVVIRPMWLSNLRIS